MTQVHIFAWLARILTVLVCWAILMGVPALLFSPPMDDTKYKIFLGVFYTILLFLGTVISRSWGGWGVLTVAAPFMVLFVAVIAQHLSNPSLSTAEKAMATLNFGAIFLVAWLAWRLGKRLKSPAREKGTLI